MHLKTTQRILLPMTGPLWNGGNLVSSEINDITFHFIPPSSWTSLINLISPLPPQPEDARGQRARVARAARPLGLPVLLPVPRRQPDPHQLRGHDLVSVGNCKLWSRQVQVNRPHVYEIIFLFGSRILYYLPTIKPNSELHCLVVFRSVATVEWGNVVKWEEVTAGHFD